jgi:heavy metal efflux system protein
MSGQGETVVGMVLKLIGANTSTVIADVKERMEKINKVLPPGIKIVAYYDQATLVAKCVQTVTKALAEAVVLVVLIQLVMLGALRPSVVVLLAIPFSRLPSCSCGSPASRPISCRSAASQSRSGCSWMARS